MEKEELKLLLKKFDILIVDSCTFSRKRLQNLLQNVGALSEKIHHAFSMDEAKDLVANRNIDIIFSEYSFESSNVFDLSRFFNENSNDSNKRIFIITTANGRKDVVVKSTTHEVDFYLLKPFSEDFFISSITEVIARKYKTTTYMELIEQGKKFLKNHQMNEARDVLKRAIALNTKPVLAHYYLGETDSSENKLNAAVKDYRTGLMYDNEHYKSLRSLYEIYNKTESYDDAYEIAKKIALTFPSSAEELEQLIRLTVRTKNFQDMTIFHELAKSVEHKDRILLNYIGSGLFVTGKYYLFHGLNDEAIDCFKKIVNTCPEFPKFIKGIIYTLLDYELFDDAETYIDYVKKSDFDFRVCDFLIKRKRSSDSNEIIAMGVKILSEKKDDYVLMAVLDEMEKSGKSIDEINKLKKSFSKIAV